MYNVIGELQWSEPDTIITIGGHLDAWHLAQGAQDDGLGVVQALSVVDFFIKHNIKPKYTIRVIWFANEENGFRGATVQGQSAAQEQLAWIYHLLAMENDQGGWFPSLFESRGPLRDIYLTKWKPILEQYFSISAWSWEGGATDIGTFPANTTKLGLFGDLEKYFIMHHATSDTFDRVNLESLQLWSAQMLAIVLLCMGDQN